MAAREIRALVLPIVVAGVIPWVLAAREGAPHRWPPPPIEGLISIIILAAGLYLLVAMNVLFLRYGAGTLAPWDPPERLVIRGVYRHVRNPMITGVLLIILAEAVALASPSVGIWFAVAVLVNLAYMPLSEEPGLEGRFGEQYREYKRNVPAWIPRLTPWDGVPFRPPEG